MITPTGGAIDGGRNTGGGFEKVNWAQVDEGGGGKCGRPGESGQVDGGQVRRVEGEVSQMEGGR